MVLKVDELSRSAKARTAGAGKVTDKLGAKLADTVTDAAGRAAKAAKQRGGDWNWTGGKDRTKGASRGDAAVGNEWGKMSRKGNANGASAKDKPIVKVPGNPIGRAVFFGGKAMAAVSAVRVIRDARRKGDKLALAHGALTAAGLLVTAALAARFLREERAERAAAAAAPAAEPRALVAGKRG